MLNNTFFVKQSGCRLHGLMQLVCLINSLIIISTGMPVDEFT
jgi:hypothetical protein